MRDRFAFPKKHGKLLLQIYFKRCPALMRDPGNKKVHTHEFRKKQSLRRRP